MAARLLTGENGRRLRVQALVALGVAILFGGVAVLIYYAMLPFAGFELAGPARVGAVVSGSPAEAAGVEVGDRVLTVDGEPFRLGQAYLHPGQKTMQLTVSRDGHVVPVEISLVTPTIKERFLTSGHLLVALAFWIVAMAVLAFKPRDAVAQLFVLTTQLVVLVLVVWLLADLGLAWANMLMASGVIAIGPLFVTLHMLFPERIGFRSKRTLLASLYVVALILLLLSNASDLAYYLQLGPGNSWLISLSLTPFIVAFFTLCMLIGLAALLRARLGAKTQMGRRRAGMVLLGTVLALLPLIVFIVIPAVFEAPYLLPTWLALVPLVLIPLSYVYAMYRRDLIKLDGSINRSVVIYLLSLTLAGLYVGISLGLWRIVPDASSGTVTLADAGLFVGLVLVVNPLKTRAQIFVDRMLYGGWYDYQSFISATSQALRDAQDVADVGAVLQQYMVGAMHFKSFVLLLRDRQSHDFAPRDGLGFESVPPVDRKGLLARSLLDGGVPVEHAALNDQSSPRSETGRQLARWSATGAQWWVPLIQRGELIGILVLGSKQGDDFVTQGDLDILATLAQQVAVAIRRLQLIDELQGQVEEVRTLGRQILALQEKNQHHLSRELHDLVLQQLAVARMRLEHAQTSIKSEDIKYAHDILLKQVDVVRSLTVELRTPDWEDQDLRTALEDYAFALEDKQKLPIVFQADGHDPGASLSNEVRTAVYRIFQESVNNAGKYAKAEQIEATLRLQPDCVCLEVRDDGIGFEMPAHLGGHVGKGKLGLISMRERAEEVGGTCVVESKPGHGTRVMVEIPLTAGR